MKTWQAAVVVAIALAGIALGIGLWWDEQDYRTNYSRWPTEQLQQAIQQREHQRQYHWFGENDFYIGPRTSGASGRGSMDWRGGSVSPLPYELRDRFSASADVLLPLLDNKDVDVIMTALWVAGIDGETSHDPPDVGRFEEAVRQKLLAHQDAHLRVMAIRYLGPRQKLLAEEIDRLLEDEHTAVYRQMADLFHAYRDLDHANRQMLITVLLEHLNHIHPYTRHAVARMLEQLTGRRLRAYGFPEGRPSVDGQGPRRIDWLRADWWTRDEMQKQWQDWWKTQSTGTPSGGSDRGLRMESGGRMR